MLLNSSKVLLAGASLLVASSAFSPAFAQSDADKAAIKASAIELCENAAEARYGENSVKSTGKKVRWKRGLNGMVVKMKIKPKSKKPSKYTCVVNIDKEVEFYKG